MKVKITDLEFQADGTYDYIQALISQWYDRRVIPMLPEPFAPVVVKLGPMIHKTTDQGGTMADQTIALVLPDDCFVPVEIATPLLDNGGNPILNTDGTPYVPEIAMNSADESVAFCESGAIYGQHLGQTVVSVVVPFPDSSVQTVDILTTVTPSEAGPVNITLGEIQHGEPA